MTPGLGAPAAAIPHLVIRDFLGDDAVAALLAYVEAHEHEFQPTGVGYGQHRRLDPAVRQSHRLRGRAHVPPLLVDRLASAAPTLVNQLGLTPFTIARTEVEIVAHGEGAFYGEHTDMFTGDGNPGAQRMLSCVYYFHRNPKRFSGGALRLYGLDRGHGRPSADVVPERDSLVAFPSFLRHEVLPVSCESGQFLDSRFAINCWLWRHV